jgi:predicted dehydrogenase
MRTIRWGIIGCGDVTEVKSGPGFQKARGSALVAVMRRDGAKAADYARRHGVPRWYDDADRLIADPEVDAVYIATPPGLHEFYAHKVCAAGKPCYVEKPMARNTAEAQRMVDAFAAAKLPLFVAYYRRTLPRFVKVKEIIDSGALGQLRSVQYKYADAQMSQRKQPLPWRLDAQEAGAGLFLDLGSHALDLIDHLLGPFSDVSGNARNYTRNFAVEDYVEVRFRAGHCVHGLGRWDFSGRPNLVDAVGDYAPWDDYIVEFDLGRLQFSCFRNTAVLIRHHDETREEFQIAHPPHVAQPLIQTIVDELLGVTPPGSCPSTGASALRTQHVMDQALSTYYGGREDGFWNRPWPKG